MRNTIAVVFTIIGGIFYVIGGIVVISVAGSVASTINSFGDLGSLGLTSPTTAVNTSGVSSLVYGIGSFGILSGILIIAGGVLFSSDKGNWRKAGGVMALVMLLLGSIPAIGGLFIGFTLGLVGCYSGLKYKAKKTYGVGLTPFGLTLVPQPTTTTPAPTATTPPAAGTGPLHYCIKCGSRLHDGAVFCGACGTRVPE